LDKRITARIEKTQAQKPEEKTEEKPAAATKKRVA
jgi:hypothetical protein